MQNLTQTCKRCGKSFKWPEIEIMHNGMCADCRRKVGGKWTKHNEVLDNINDEAAKKGMSYGQYVAWLESQKGK